MSSGNAPRGLVGEIVVGNFGRFYWDIVAKKRIRAVGRFLDKRIHLAVVSFTTLLRAIVLAKFFFLFLCVCVFLLLFFLSFFPF